MDNVVSTNIASLRDAGCWNSNCYPTMVHMRTDPKFVGMLSTILNGWCPCSYRTRGFNTPGLIFPIYAQEIKHLSNVLCNLDVGAGGAVQKVQMIPIKKSPLTKR